MMATGARRKSEDLEVSHNLAGQRLGRKGQDTRERIITAAVRLLDDPQGPPVTLTGVAGEAAIRLTNLYLYFPDFNSLLLAALRRVMADADQGFLARSEYWPDAGLPEACATFLHEHYGFWRRHARMLHMRNNLSETDPRLLEYRQEATRPLLEFVARQMSGEGGNADRVSRTMATVVLTGIERLATVATNPHFHAMANDPVGRTDEVLIEDMLIAEARLLELAIRDCRAAQH